MKRSVKISVTSKVKTIFSTDLDSGRRPDHNSVNCVVFTALGLRENVLRILGLRVSRKRAANGVHIRVRLGRD